MNNQIDELHSKAMEFADDAFIARRKGLIEQAKQLSYEAFQYERDAALLLEKTDIEPSRSVLFRSAGWLAFNSEKYEQAEEMVNYGLKGNPPCEIKAELDELYYEINEILAVKKVVINEKRIFLIFILMIVHLLVTEKLNMDFTLNLIMLLMN